MKKLIKCHNCDEVFEADIYNDTTCDECGKKISYRRKVNAKISVYDYLRFHFCSMPGSINYKIIEDFKNFVPILFLKNGYYQIFNPENMNTWFTVNVKGDKNG